MTAGGWGMAKGNYYVYITTNPGKTVLYVGVTNDLRQRIMEHEANRGNNRTFAGKYFCYKLIYYEHFFDIRYAILREKEIKNMTRKKKEELIATMNPHWNLLSIF
jgi:putative endonuclease